MGQQDARVDAYIEKAADFAKPILSHLRRVVHAGCPNVQETIKWGFPHFEHKGLLASKGELAPHDHVVPLGEAAVVRPGDDVTIVALASTVPTALSAAEQLSAEDISVEVIDLRCLVPLDAKTVLSSVERTSRLLVVEENPYQGGWGATVASIVADEGFESLDAPVRRVASECVPLPFADALEDEVIPTVAKVLDAVRRLAAF